MSRDKNVLIKQLWFHQSQLINPLPKKSRLKTHRIILKKRKFFVPTADEQPLMELSVKVFVSLTTIIKMLDRIILVKMMELLSN